MKNSFTKKLIRFCVIPALVICMLFSGCASRRSVPADEFSAVCASYGITLEDTSSYYDSTFITDAMIYSDGTCSAAYYTFAQPSDAKAYYAQYFSKMYVGTSDEKYIDSSEYNRYIASNDSGIGLLYRNGANLIYLAGSDTEKVNAIIDELGI